MFTMMLQSETHKAARMSAARAGRQKQEELIRQEFEDAGRQAKRLLDAMSAAPNKMDK